MITDSLIYYRSLCSMWVVDKVYKGIWIFGILYMLYRCFFAG